MQKREKRIPLKTSLDEEGVAALELLRLSSHGVEERFIVNAALCNQASRISKEARERLQEAALKRDTREIRRLKQENETIKAQLEKNQALQKDLLKQFSEMAGYVRKLSQGLRERSGGDDTAQ